MTSFPSSLKSVFSGRTGGETSFPYIFQKSWPLFKITPPPAPDGRPAADLAKMVESEIIPRLMLAHRAAQAEADDNAVEALSLGDEMTEVFAGMVLAKEPDSLIAFVGKLLRDGLSMDAIYGDLLAPAARRLGDYWNEDRASFAEVTIGLGRLQQVVRALGYRTPRAGDNDPGAPSILLAPATREQHTFGLFIIEESFRQSGWRTWVETAATNDELADTVRCHWFDLFGLSASRDTEVGQITDSIKRIRRASRNQDLFILVGGRLFIERPDLVAVVGADATAAGGSEALQIADKAVRRLAIE